MDNESYENFFAKKLVEYLQLSTHPHEMSYYSLGWVKRGPQVQVSQIAKCMFLLVSIIKMIYYVMSLIWMLVLFCLGDLGNMMWMKR